MSRRPQVKQLSGDNGYLSLTGGTRIVSSAADSDDTDSPVTLTASSDKYQFADTTNGGIEYDLPALSTVPDGFEFVFKIAAGANSVTLDPSGTEDIEGSSTSFAFSGVLTSITIRAKTTGSHQGWWIH